MPATTPIPVIRRHKQPITLDYFFARRVISKKGCWLWQGCLLNSGYGTAGKYGPVHRVIYTLLVGPIPPGLHIDHLCRERRCFNPAHLEPVTPLENARRAHRTHCKKGHPLSEENLYLTSRGPHRSNRKRLCRICNLASQRRRYANRRRQCNA